jgi:ElaB/YqjD/DUF883 family membrane-anchored ribosome-binding protein
MRPGTLDRSKTPHRKEKTMDEARTDFQAHQQRLKQDLQAVVEDAQALLRCVGEQATEGYAQSRARLEQSLQAAQDALQGLHAGAREQARVAGRMAGEYVEDNPWVAIGIAAAAGALLGALLSRR